MMRRILKFFFLCSLAQTSYGQNIELETSDPIVAAKIPLFYLNPAAVEIKETMVGGVLGSSTKNMTYDQSSNQAQTFTSQSKKSFYGVSVLADIGAGAAVGAFYHELKSESKSTTTLSAITPEENVKYQTYGGTMAIDLTKEFTVALQIRFLNENVDRAGTLSNTQDRITYTGVLSGYTAGGAYHSEGFMVGGSYQPPFRGKAEILLEDRLITEPGYTFLHMQYQPNPWSFGINYMRWLYQKDEREGTILSEDGARQLSMRGQDFDRFLFPVTKLGAAVAYRFSNKALLSVFIQQHTDVFVFATDDVPDDKNDERVMRYNELGASLGFEILKCDLELGYKTFSRSHDFKGEAGRTGKYDAKESGYFISLQKSL